MIGEPNTCSMEEDKIMEEDGVIVRAIVLLENAAEELEKHNDGKATDLSGEIREFFLELGVNRTETMSLQESQVTYGDIILDFNQRGLAYEGTHSIVNFASEYYPKYFESFYKILMSVNSLKDTEKNWNVILSEQNSDLTEE